MTTAIRIIPDQEQAACLLEPTRLRLVAALRAQADSAAGVARRLGLPRQRVNYHLRELERFGLVQLVEERRKGNCTERIIRPSATAYLVSPDVLGSISADPHAAKDRFSWSHLVMLAAGVVRDLGVLRSRADRAGKRLATLAIEADVRIAPAQAQSRFADDLARAVAQVVAHHHDEQAEGGRTFRVVVGAYPKITRHEDTGETPVPPKEDT